MADTRCAPGSERQRFRLVTAVHLLLWRDRRLLLLRRANTGYADGCYSVPAGHLDGGETVLAAARREAMEEVGLDLPAATLQIVQVMHRAAELPPDDERIDYFVAATGWTGEPANREPNKCDELRWANPDALPAPMVPYVVAAIAAWRAGIPFTAFGW